MDYRVDPMSDRPAYKQIADALREAIRSGELTPGSRLPSEADMMRDFGVAQGTARNALNVLRGEGLIYSEHGRGVFVRKRPHIRRLASDRLRRSRRESGQAAYMVDAESRGSTPRVEIDRIGPEPVPADVAPLLSLEPGTRVLVRSRRYLTDDYPTQLATSYIPWELAHGTAMEETNPGPGGIYARLEDAGHRLAKFTEDVTARMPTPEEASALLLPRGVPVLTVVRTAYAEGDTPVEVCSTVMTSDLYLLSYEIPAD